MTETIPPNEPGTGNGRSRALWIGLLAGPVIWSIYFVIIYLLAEIACGLNLLQFTVWGVSIILLLVQVITVLALLPILYIGFQAYRRWQRLRHDEIEIGEQPAEFMALGGVLLGLLFALATLVTGVSALVVQPCRWI